MGETAIGATVNMGKAEFDPQKIPVVYNKEVIGEPLKIVGEEEPVPVTCVSMGNPHCVVFCDDPESLVLERIGPLFENSPLFPERVNTEFVTVTDKTNLKMRVWERGSGETLACGTGACAAVAAAVKNGFCEEDTEVSVHLRGGILKIRYTNEAVFMTGNAVKAFQGEVEV